MSAMRPETGLDWWERILCIIALLPFALAYWLDQRKGSE